MSSGLATITVVGTIGSDAEQRTAGGSQLVSWRMAVNSRQGKNEVTDWYTCTLWGARGESLLRHLKKGKQVAVSGGFHTRSYETQSGEARTSLEVRVDGFSFAGGPRDASGADRGEQSSYTPPSGNGAPNPLEDDIPF